jgi:hypothetical protein
MDNVIVDVVDSLSGAALVGALVSLNNQPQGQTDQYGAFTLTEPDESDEVEISFPGYPTYKISAGILEGTAQIQMSKSMTATPTVAVTPSPAASSVWPWVIAAGAGIFIFSGKGKKVGASKQNTALIIGAGALGLGAVYLMSRPSTTTNPSSLLNTQQLIAAQAAAKANPVTSALSSGGSLFSSLSKLFTGGSSTSATAQDVSNPAVSLPSDTSVQLPSYDAPSIDNSGINLDTSSPMDLEVDESSAEMAGLPGRDNWGRGRTWSNGLGKSGVGASYGFKSNGRNKAVFGSLNFDATDDSGGDEGKRSYLYRRMTKKSIGASYGFKSNGINRATFGSYNFNKTDDSYGDEGIYHQKKKSIGDTVNVNDPTFSASQIVGQSLIALTSVNTYAEPFDGEPILNTYSPGQTVGVVTSWNDADPTNGRSVLYWQFMDANGNYYYAPHYTGEFNVQSLIDAGALTTGAQTQAAIDASKGTIETEIDKYLPMIIGVGAGIGILAVVLKNKK